jgi:hypothetical protein
MDKPARGRTHPHNFPEKERSEGQENTAAAVEVRLPSPEDDYAEPDFESVFFHIAPACTVMHPEEEACSFVMVGAHCDMHAAA